MAVYSDDSVIISSVTEIIHLNNKFNLHNK
jgi:hypothetical protein